MYRDISIHICRYIYIYVYVYVYIYMYSLLGPSPLRRYLVQAHRAHCGVAKEHTSNDMGIPNVI